MNYWLDLFTGTTWTEFLSAGGRITGFREKTKRDFSLVKSGDIFLCYLTGIMHWVGALEVVGPTKDKTAIWKSGDYPIRFEVISLVTLDPRYGVPMKELEGKVAFYAGPDDAGGFKGFLRCSPNRFKSPADGEFILALVKKAQENPVAKPIDVRKFGRTYRVKTKAGKREKETEVTVPDALEETGTETEDRGPSHVQMQWELLSLGSEMGLDVWVARNDRSKSWGDKSLAEVPRLLDDLPRQFNEATTKTIELIDVLWLRENTIVAAFEVEHTTSIYSGLLRMSDLLSLQPNLDINLYLVAPDDRRDKVASEIKRPTFAIRDKPLPDVCGFVSYSKLQDYTEKIRELGLAASLNPNFLDKSVAEYFRD